MAAARSSSSEHLRAVNETLLGLLQSPTTAAAAAEPAYRLLSTSVHAGLTLALLLAQ